MSTSKELIDDIINNPEKLKDISKEDLLNLRKKINPYGIVLETEKSWINISITNIRDMYLRRIHMTSLVGFLFKSIEDYEFELSEEQVEQLNKISDIKKKHELENEFKEVFKKEKEIAQKFIDRQFKFNVDKHVRKITKKSDLPADVFYQWDRYLTNNYEEILDTVADIYKERHDIDYAIQYIDHFKTEKEAEEHRRRNADSFITPIFTITNNAWTLIGPYKKNLENIDFYNKNTDIIKEMIKQMEEDNKIGKDIMEKRVKLNKKQNVALEGPDDRGLSEYTAALGTIESLSIKKGLSDDEKKELEKAKKIKDDTEVPTDALGVDMYYTDEGEFKRTRFHTKVVEPTSKQ